MPISGWIDKENGICYTHTHTHMHTYYGLLFIYKRK
jgi:hypothetical protein